MIFITEKDFLRAGNSLAEVVRTIKGTRKQIDNGVHEIYVNLEHSSENEELQRLLSYFRHTEEDGVSVEGFRHLAERVRYLKKEEGVKDMCELMEREWAAGRAVGWVDGRAEGKIEDILDILSEIGIVSSDLRKKVSQETAAPYNCEGLSYGISPLVRKQMFIIKNRQLGSVAQFQLFKNLTKIISDGSLA